MERQRLESRRQYISTYTRMVVSDWSECVPACVLLGRRPVSDRSVGVLLLCVAHSVVSVWSFVLDRIVMISKRST